MEQTVDVKSALNGLQGNFVDMCYCKIAVASSKTTVHKWMYFQSNYKLAWHRDAAGGLLLYRC